MLGIGPVFFEDRLRPQALYPDRRAELLGMRSMRLGYNGENFVGFANGLFARAFIPADAAPLHDGEQAISGLPEHFEVVGEVRLDVIDGLELGRPRIERRAGSRHAAIVRCVREGGDTAYGLVGLDVDDEGRARAMPGAEAVPIPEDGYVTLGSMANPKYANRPRSADDPTRYIPAASIWGSDASYGPTTSGSHIRLGVRSGGVLIEEGSQRGTWLALSADAAFSEQLSGGA